MTLKANFSWTLLGTVSTSGANWVTLLLLARWESTEALGLYSMAIALVRPLLTLAGLQLRGIQATDAARAFKFIDYLMLRLLMLSLVVIVTLLLASSEEYHPDFISILLPVVLALLINQVIDIYNGRFQQWERMDLIAKGELANGLLTILAFFTGLYLFQSVVIALYFSAGISLLILAFWIIPNGRHVASAQETGPVFVDQNRQEGWSRIWKLFILALPMGLVMTIGSLNTSVPRVVIGANLGAEQLGEYTAVTSLLTLGTTLFSALGHSASPRLAKFFATGNLSEFFLLFRNMLLMASLLGASAIVAALLLGPQVVGFLYGANYATNSTFIYMTAATGAVMFISSVFGYTNTAMRQFKVQVPINVVALAVLIACSFFWVSRYGISGAVGAVAASYGAKSIASMIAIHSGIRTEMARSASG